MGSNAARDRFAASLLRPKDSHELLSKVSLKRSNTHQPRDALAAPREPKHFTVSNVGQNGKIFLRYVPWPLGVLKLARMLDPNLPS